MLGELLILILIKCYVAKAFLFEMYCSFWKENVWRKQDSIAAYAIKNLYPRFIFTNESSFRYLRQD